jgi:ubiquinone/menaquinone biosynthesis C-methylase UbiE
MSHFNQVANSWDTPEKTIQNQKYAKKITSLMPSPNNSPLKILEVGCGTGLLGSQFVFGNNQLIGLDTSAGMLEVFNKKFLGNKNIHSQLLNLEEENLNEGNFDLIISAMAFHHLKNPQSILHKLKKMLSPKGVIAVIDLDFEDGSFHPDPKNMGVHHFGFSEETTQKWSKLGGFSKSSREIVNTIEKNDKSYPIFLSMFFNS